MLPSSLDDALDLLASLIAESLVGARSNRYQILQILESLKRDFSFFVAESINRAQRRAFVRTSPLLPTKQRIRAFGSSDSQIISSKTLQLIGRDINKYFGSLKTQLLKVLDNPKAVLSKTQNNLIAEIQKSRRGFRRLVQSLKSEVFVAPIIGKDRKFRYYQASSYLDLVLQSAEGFADRELVVHLMSQVRMDLVLISPQPSKVGDFCDAYAGKVFSLSGSSSIFPPLSETPNSGPPFHPFCSHTLIPWLGRLDELSEEEIAELTPDPQYLLRDDITHNDLLKRWSDNNE